MTSRAKRDQSTNALHERDDSSSIDSGSSWSLADSEDGASSFADTLCSGMMENLKLFNKLFDSTSLHSSDLYYAPNSIDSTAYAVDDYIDGEKENKKRSKKGLTRGIGINCVSKKIDYTSVMARLYRAIDAKEWGIASHYLIETPELASYWVYRRDEGQKEVKWIFLPIHAACFSGAPPSFVSNLIRAHPESAGIGTPGTGKLPIHIACETGAYHAIVSCLVLASPESLYHKDNDGNTPLQLCIFSTGGQNRDNIIQILTKLAKERSDPKLTQFRELSDSGGKRVLSERRNMRSFETGALLGASAARIDRWHDQIQHDALNSNMR